MKKSKQAVAFALTGLFISFSALAHAETVTATVRSESSGLANIPFVLLALAAIVGLVYLCNPPRVAVCARARCRR